MNKNARYSIFHIPYSMLQIRRVFLDRFQYLGKSCWSKRFDKYHGWSWPFKVAGKMQFHDKLHPGGESAYPIDRHWKRKSGKLKLATCKVDELTKPKTQFIIFSSMMYPHLKPFDQLKGFWIRAAYHQGQKELFQQKFL